MTNGLFTLERVSASRGGRVVLEDLPDDDPEAYALL